MYIEAASLAHTAIGSRIHRVSFAPLKLSYSTGRLVVGSVTTSEHRLLYIFFFCSLALQFPFMTLALSGGVAVRIRVPTYLIRYGVHPFRVPTKALPAHATACVYANCCKIIRHRRIKVCKKLLRMVV